MNSEQMNKIIELINSPNQEDLYMSSILDQLDTGKNAYISPQLYKWMKIFSLKDMFQVSSKIAESVSKSLDLDIISDFDNYMDTHPEEKNMLMGDISDMIKDAAIEKYVDIIDKNKEYTFDDEEIQSEVLDYLHKHKYKVIQQDNKIKIL